MLGPGRRAPAQHVVDPLPYRRQGSHARPGPTSEHPLFTTLYRAAVATVAAVLVAAGFAATPTIATPPPAEPVYAWDGHAERQELVAAQRASRTSIDPAAVSKLEKVPQPAKPTTQAQPPSKPEKAPAKPPSSKPAAPPVKASGSAATVVAFLRAQLGKPYVYGAAGPSSYDCSGLTMRAFERVGIRLPHQSEAQARYGRAVPRSQTRAGDLLHWPGHVGIAISATQMIHASRAGQPVKVAAIYGTPTVRRIVG